MSIVEGWTNALPFTLKNDGEPMDLTGLTVSIVLKNAEGATVKNTTEGVTVTDSTGGELNYEPSSSSGDLFLSAQTPYRVRFKLQDVAGKIAYVPNDEEELIEVNEP